MSDLFERKLNNIFEAEDFVKSIIDMDKIHPGFFENLSTSYLTFLEREYPDFIDPYIRKSITVRYGQYFERQPDEKLQHIMAHIQQEMPLGYTEARVIAVIGWAFLMMKEPGKSLWFLTQAHLTRIMGVDSFYNTMEEAKVDVATNKKFNAAIDEFMVKLKELAIKQYRLIK